MRIDSGGERQAPYFHRYVGSTHCESHRPGEQSISGAGSAFLARGIVVAIKIITKY
jgi:hypothetical protein